MNNKLFATVAAAADPGYGRGIRPDDGHRFNRSQRPRRTWPDL